MPGQWVNDSTWNGDQIVSTSIRVVKQYVSIQPTRLQLILAFPFGLKGNNKADMNTLLQLRKRKKVAEEDQP